MLTPHGSTTITTIATFTLYTSHVKEHPINTFDESNIAI
jgi:hypothetical protein